MTSFMILLRRMIALVFMMGCGYFSYKKNWVEAKGYGALSTIVAQILNPLLIINSVLVADHSAISNENMAINLLFVAIYYVVLIVIGLLIGFVLNIKDGTKYQYNSMIVFSNVGFMAIPILSALFGSSSTVYIIFYVIMFNVLIYSYGIFLAAKSKGGKVKIPWLKMINSGSIASILAIILYFCNVTADKVGDPIVTICSYLGNATIPFSMFVTGISIAMFPVKEYLAGARVYIFSVIKLLVIPIVAALILKGFAVDPMVKSVFIYELAMPVGALVLMINRNYGENELVSSKGIVITTILSIITIPLISFFC